MRREEERSPRRCAAPAVVLAHPERTRGDLPLHVRGKSPRAAGLLEGLEHGAVGLGMAGQIGHASGGPSPLFHKRFTAG
jgi:hypothetical protein